MIEKRPTRVGFLTNMYTPYKEAMLREIAKLVDLKVYYCAERESDRDWEVKFSGTYNYELLPGKTFDFGKRKLHFNPSFASRIAADSIDLMIVGEWCNPTVVMAPFWLRLRAMPRILWSGSTALEQGKLRILTEPIKRLIIAQYDGYVNYTKRAAEYVQYLGAPADRVTVAPVTIDTDFFSAQRKRLHQYPGRPFIRRQLGLGDDEIAVIFVGQMIHRKGVDLLIKAIAGMKEPRIKVFLAGSGPAQDEFEGMASALGVLKQMNFLGHCSQEKLAELYLAADVFTLPSRREPSGNVINEAMSMGLPVVISDQIGCDCVTHGKTGFVFESENVTAYAEYLQKIAVDEDLRSVMGKASLKDLMSKFSIQVEANQFAKAVATTLGRLGKDFVPKTELGSLLNSEARQS